MGSVQQVPRGVPNTFLAWVVAELVMGSCLAAVLSPVVLRFLGGRGEGAAGNR